MYRGRGRGGYVSATTGRDRGFAERRRYSEDDGGRDYKRSKIDDRSIHERGRSSRRGNAGRRRVRLSPESFRRQVEIQREKDKQDEIRSFDNIVTKPFQTVKTGKNGTLVNLTANFFNIRFTRGSTWMLYHYDVSFNPPDFTTRDKHRIFSVFSPTFQGYTFDGTSLFTPINHGDDPILLNYQGGNEHPPCTITVRKVSTVVPGDTQYLQIYAIIIRNCLRAMGMEELGRNLFDKSRSTKIVQYGLELWPGAKTSVRNFDGGVMLNLDISYKLLRMETCLEMIKRYEHDRRNAKKDLVGSIVITKYSRKTFKITDIDEKSSPNSTFRMGDRLITYMEYYAERYPEFPITDPYQPLLVSKPSKREQRLGNNRTLKLIPELCNLTGISDEIRKDFEIMRAIHKVTSIEPNERSNQLTSFIKRLSTTPEAKEVLDSWGMEIESSLVKFDGRRLPKEKLKMRCDRTFNDLEFEEDDYGDWTNYLKSNAMYSTVSLDKWSLLVQHGEQMLVQKLIDNLKFVSKTLNFPIQQPTIQIVNSRSTSDVMKAIDDTVYRNRDTQMIFCLLPSSHADTYSAIKRRCNVELGLKSQCLLSKTCRKDGGGFRSICTKLAIQMNAKLGGEPWICKNPFKQCETMIIGFDIHRGKKGRVPISIGAMVATTNASWSRFYSTVSNHNTRESLSLNMVSDFKSCMRAFAAVNNGKLPGRIIFYRDGVGQGDLEYVYNIEVKEIEEQINAMYSEQSIDFKGFTFIVVSKKGNARFFRNSSSRMDNPAPGTVVDNTITIPDRYDFFLISTQARARQTVSPTTYNVLRVGSDLSPDKLQILTWKFCHLYYNWSGTVAVPFVCQYAHKLSYLTGSAYGDANILQHENISNYLYFL